MSFPNNRKPKIGTIEIYFNLPGVHSELNRSGADYRETIFVVYDVLTVASIFYLSFNR